MAENLVCFVILNLLIIQHWRNGFYIAANKSTKMVNETVTGNITFLLYTQQGKLTLTSKHFELVSKAYVKIVSKNW